MKTNFSRDATGGFTLIELLAVVACVVIALSLLLPYGSGSHKSPLAPCLYHVRQINLGFLLYADDNNGKFAIQTSITNGGTMEFLDRNQTFPHYQKLSKYIVSFPVLVCPADKTRHAAVSYEHLTDTNISYFLNAEVSIDNPSKSILAGDRHLQANGKPVPHGTFNLETNMDLAWTSELHHGMGILGFADGHAEVSRTASLNTAFRAISLNTAFQNQGFAISRLSVP